jgi:hypothetical protein
MKIKILPSRATASWAVAACVAFLVLLPSSRAQTRSRVDLRENWLLQSSCKLSTPAELLSTTQFSPDRWYKTSVPSTVLAAQVASGEFNDIYVGENLRKLPGMNRSSGEPGGNPGGTPTPVRGGTELSSSSLPISMAATYGCISMASTPRQTSG